MHPTAERPTLATSDAVPMEDVLAVVDRYLDGPDAVAVRGYISERYEPGRPDCRFTLAGVRELEQGLAELGQCRDRNLERLARLTSSDEYENGAEVYRTLSGKVLWYGDNRGGELEADAERLLVRKKRQTPEAEQESDRNAATRRNQSAPVTPDWAVTRSEAPVPDRRLETAARSAAEAGVPPARSTPGMDPAVFEEGADPDLATRIAQALTGHRARHGDAAVAVRLAALLDKGSYRPEDRRRLERLERHPVVRREPVDSDDRPDAAGESVVREPDYEPVADSRTCAVGPDAVRDYRPSSESGVPESTVRVVESVGYDERDPSSGPPEPSGAEGPSESKEPAALAEQTVTVPTEPGLTEDEPAPDELLITEPVGEALPGIGPTDDEPSELLFERTEELTELELPFLPSGHEPLERLDGSPVPGLPADDESPLLTSANPPAAGPRRAIPPEPLLDQGSVEPDLASFRPESGAAHSLPVPSASRLESPAEERPPEQSRRLPESEPIPIAAIQAFPESTPFTSVRLSGPYARHDHGSKIGVETRTVLALEAQTEGAHESER